MKKHYRICAIFILCLTSYTSVFAQPCTPCPPVFTLRDSINCNSADVVKPASGVGPYTNLFATITACKNSTMKYQLTTNAVCYPIVNYTIVNVSGGILLSASANQFLIQWGASATGNVLIAFSIPPGAGSAPCRDTISLNFTLINSPTAVFTSSPQPACFNNPTNISFNSSGSVNAVTYFWDFGDGFTSTQANPVHAYTAPGTYTVTLTVSNTFFANGQPGCPTCVSSVQHTVTINPLPGPPITCIASVCANTSETYCTTASGCSSYTWTVTGGLITSGQNTPCVTVLWGSGSPQGTINLVVAGCTSSYCSQGTTVTIPIIPVTGTILGPTLVCVGNSAAYTLPAWPGTTYSWALSGGGVITPYNTNTNQININWLTTPGAYTLSASYFDSSLNCGGTASMIINVRPILSITGPSTVCEGTISTLNAVRPTNIPVLSNWTITPAGATILSGNGTGSINVSWPVAGIYTVTASSVIVNAVCSPASYIVTVLAAPVISAVTGADSICPNSTHTYAAVSNGTGLFTWNVTNGSPVFLGANNDSIQVTWNPAGPYSISVSQTSFPNNCLSNTFIKNVFPYPAPALTGPVSVCADNTETYTITNIGSGNFQWSIFPPVFGTIISGQGTATVQIKWHGNNNPGFSNIVHLYFGVCNSDSVAITINEPQAAVITATGTLCGSGITLSTGATGTFSWSCTEHPIVPTPGNTSSITGITLPGHYSVQIQNFNGTGCTVTANYFIPDTGFPVAHITADNVLNYCLSNVPNMNLVANNAPGYTFQWYTGVATPLGTNVVQPITGLTLPGTYTFYCVVSLGTCKDTSNIITISIANCPPTPGCVASINVTSITGCNPFTLTLVATAPAGATLIGNPTIFHWDDGTTVNSYTTHTFTTTGYQQITICADVLMPDNSVCRTCKDTVVLVNAAADFTSNIGCKQISFFDASTTIFPTTISSYNWAVGYFPGNTAVPPLVASFNNSTVPNPVLNVTVSGTYIISLTIKAGGCNITHMDTLTISVPNASFTPTNSCVGTAINFNNLFPAPVNFWSFGDAATSYTSPTFHAYATAGNFNVTHIVTDANGCKDTVINIVTVVAAPVCNITFASPTTFCFGDTVFLNACPGFTNYQWYNNGVAIAGATTIVDTAVQTGNYHFTALSAGGCLVVSDTVSVTVLQGPNVAISIIGNGCAGTAFSASVIPCAGCTYQWNVDGNPEGNNSQLTGVSGFAPFTTGVHAITVIVTNGSGCTDSSTIVQTFYPSPTISIAVAGNPPLMCSNNIYTMTATSNAATPAWAWTFNNQNNILSNTNILSASAAGNYNITVTDGITGCKATALQAILPSPELNLFPIGCDTLCDTSHLFLPLQSLNGNLAGYVIKWYDNAPPYSPAFATGPSALLNTLIPIPGNHNISVIVTAPNGCMDTSNVYSLRLKICSNVIAVKELVLKVKQAGAFALLNWTTNEEVDNDYFIAERSTDGIHYSFAGKVFSRGNSNQQQSYNLKDPITYFNQAIYYRIKTVDNRSSFSYSNVERLFPQKQSEESLLAIPSITSGKTEMLLLSNTASKGNLLVYSAEGKMIRSMPVNIVKGANSFILDLGDLPSGMYMIMIRTADKQLVAKLVRN
jgi:PKD repeat protein